MLMSKNAMINDEAAFLPRISPNRASKKHLAQYLELLNEIKEAQDAQELASWEQRIRRWHLPSTLHASKLSLYTVATEKGLLDLLVSATISVMALAATPSSAAVPVLRGDAVTLVAHLSGDLTVLLGLIQESAASKVLLKEKLQHVIISGTDLNQSHRMLLHLVMLGACRDSKHAPATCLGRRHTRTALCGPVALTMYSRLNTCT